MPGLLERYREHLPVTDRTPALSLHEGNTPLIPAPRLSERLGVRLHLKYEGLNPTGSFKDRGMVMAVAKAVEDGADTVICASTGNISKMRAGSGVPRGRGASPISRFSSTVRRGKISRPCGT